MNSSHTNVLHMHRSGKIQGHFGIDYSQDFCATWFGKEDKYPTCSYKTTLTTQTTMTQQFTLNFETF